ncbi:Exodeoxyribonuclease 7 small subunit [Rubripirellula lacrimiformis]|uniref:Exodeoxyribonuclease 7 small subunit n=1 Tax=Rubripirellula lacrimiformis TaxID=1930273 RepID=A0A517N8H1_9BACT|nr:Exodeoxyribonuclease 7 small subunit [Rubripirellula lacrimiformis]
MAKKKTATSKKGSQSAGSGVVSGNSGDSSENGGQDVDGINFETALAEVEQIVAELESGDLGLTESLGQYEVGVKRLKQCHRILAAAEQKVSVLAGFDSEGNPVTEPIAELEVRGGGGRTKASAGRQSAAKTQKKSTSGVPDALSQSGDGETVDDSPGLF